jgi:UPF0716 protein FxsA
VLVPLVLLILLVPLAELAVIIAVGREIGIAPTLLLLVGISVLGAWLVRRQGPDLWRRIQTELRAGRVPAAAVVDGALLLLAGALLLTPGFLTDVVALVLLVPPLRAAIRGFGTRRMARRAGLRVGVVTARARPGSRPVGSIDPPRPDPSDRPPAPPGPDRPPP